MEYRDDAQKIVVVITNEDDDGANNNTAVKERTLQRVDDENACLVAFSPDSDRDYNDLNTYTEEVNCGHWSNFETQSFTDVAAVIEEEASSDSKTSKRTGGYDFDIVKTSVSDATVDAGETFTAEVVVENNGVDGEFHAEVTDGFQRHYNKRVFIESGETHTFTAPITYTEPGTNPIHFNREFIEYVSVNREPLRDDEIEISDTTMKRSIVMPDESYKVSASVKNTANRAGHVTVDFTAGEDGNSTTYVANETVYLSSGETKTVTHEATADANVSGTNQTWAVENTTVGNVSILDENDSQVGIDAYATPKAVEPNEPYDVTGVVYNNDNNSQLVSVNVGSEQRQLGTLYMVEVGPHSSVDLTHTVESATKTISSESTTPAQAANTVETNANERQIETWWINNESVNVTVAVGN
jgi:hypothetical protein